MLGTGPSPAAVTSRSFDCCDGSDGSTAAADAGGCRISNLPVLPCNFFTAVRHADMEDEIDELLEQVASLQLAVGASGVSLRKARAAATSVKLAATPVGAAAIAGAAHDASIAGTWLILAEDGRERQALLNHRRLQRRVAAHDQDAL